MEPVNESGDRSNQLSDPLECDHRDGKRKKVVLVITPENMSYNFRHKFEKNQQFDPSNESETKTISCNLKNHKCAEILFRHTSSISEIAEICRDKSPHMLIFYTHGLPHDIKLSDENGEQDRHMSSNQLKEIFVYVKRNNKAFNPFILLGACYSDSMAEAIHKSMGFPVVGFTGEIRPSVLTQFIIFTIISFAHDVQFEDAFKFGLEEIKSNEEFKLAKLHAKSKPHSWYNYFSSFLVNEAKAQATSTFERFGFFQRLGSLTSDRHIFVENTHTEMVIFTVFTNKKQKQNSNDQIQLQTLSPNAKIPVFFPNNNLDVITISMFTLHESGIGFLHHQTRNVEHSHNFMLKKKVLPTHHTDIPGFKGVTSTQIKKYHDKNSSSTLPISSKNKSCFSSMDAK